VRKSALLTRATLDGSLAGVERLSGATFFSLPTPKMTAPPVSRFWRALNGVVGDHLARTDNPLALPMQLRPRGRKGNRLPRDGAWSVHETISNGVAKDMDHGAMLEAHSEWSPVYVRYKHGQARIHERTGTGAAA